MALNSELGGKFPFDRNCDEYKRLVSAVSDGAVLFVGSGSSCRLGYPSWPQLLGKLHESIANPENYTELKNLENVDGLIRASEYRKILGKHRFIEVLQDIFATRSPPHDDFHEALVGLPFKHILTTNYDYVLESAHAGVNSVEAEHFDVDEWSKLTDLWQQIADGGHRRYVHVHGSINRPDGIVLCFEDYNGRYFHENRAKAFLKDILSGQRVVFVGYSFSDVDLGHILREVAATVGFGQPRHFILLPTPQSPSFLPAMRIEYTKKYLVEPIFFDNSSGDYSSLFSVVAALKEDVAAERAAKKYIEIDAASSLVSHLIEEQPDRLDNLQHRIFTLLQPHAISVTLNDTVSGTTGIDAEITQAFGFVGSGHPAAAIESLEVIGRKYEHQLTPRHRYRLEANIGNALFAQGKFDEAGTAYLRAVGHYRQSRDARALEVLGHVLLQDWPMALGLAEGLCTDEPDFARARSLWIRSQPDDIDFEVVLESVPEGLRGDAEVALALGDLAWRRGNFAIAEGKVRQAVLASPEWIDALNMLATLILTRETGKAAIKFEHGFMSSPDRVREAEQALTAVIALTPKTDPRGSLGTAYYNRAVARRLLGIHQSANNDLERAFQLDARNPAIAYEFAVQAENDGDRLRALQVIEELPGDIPERDMMIFAKVVLLFRRALPESNQAAISIVRDVVGRLSELTPASLRPEFVQVGLHILVASNRGAECPAFVSSVPTDSVPSYVLARLTGNAELAAGNREGAAKHARQAINELHGDVGWFEQREIALLAENCGLHTAALNLWESVLGDSFFGNDTDHFMRCALHSGEWKRLLQACARLRASGYLRRDHALAEAQVLAQSRETNRALSVLKEWLADHPDDKSVRLRMSELALQQGRLEFAEFDENRLPTVDELENINDGAALVFVLRRGESPNRAFDVAYDLYRRFPDSRVAQLTLVACVFDPSVDQIDIERPTVVGKNTAVCIRRSTDKSAGRWIYVERGTQPAVTRGEYSEAHELVKSLWRRSTGDRVQFQGHEYEVIQVQNKALRRVHEIMETFEENFPDARVLRRFDVATKPTPPASLEELLGEEITEEVKKQSKHREQLESKYTGNQLPLTSFARLMGRPTFDAVRYLAYSPSHVVRFHTGDIGDWIRGLRSLSTKQELVLDSTALASALILELLPVLPQIGHKFVVPQAAIDEIREISLNAGSRKTSRGTIGFHQGRVFFHEASTEELAREVEALERVQRFVRDHCEVIGGESTLDFTVEVRGQLESALGESATDALALAKKRNAVLWTDDLGIQISASTDFQLRSVWSQAVMQSACAAGAISKFDYDKCICKLVHYQYAFTMLSADDIAMILERAGWQTKRALGLAAVRLVADVALITPRNCIIVGASILLVWQQCRKRGLARDVVVAILEEIGRDRAEPLIRVICSSPIPMFREKSVRPLKRVIRSWRGRTKEFRPGRITQRGSIH